jgi:hypothetical protein
MSGGTKTRIAASQLQLHQHRPLPSRVLACRRGRAWLAAVWMSVSVAQHARARGRDREADSGMGELRSIERTQRRSRLLLPQVSPARAEDGDAPWLGRRAPVRRCREMAGDDRVARPMIGLLRWLYSPGPSSLCLGVFG